jgi:1-hydroxycarotenoid 3,4-desaturase
MLARRDEQVVVIGAGIGGLVSAIELARAGFAVTVMERAAQAGGKMREVEAGGARLDAGPTVFTMRWVFDEIFQAAGSSLEQHVRLTPARILARHAWNDAERLDLHADIDASADAIAAFAGPADARGYRAFCDEAGRIYDTLRDTFLNAQQTGPVGLARNVGLTRMGALLGIRPFETLWSALGAHFHDPRLRQLFGRYATYCGASPFAAPATLMLIAHVEQAGVWMVEGGMQRLAEALERLAGSLGVVFRYGAHVDQVRVERGRAAGVTLADGEQVNADFVIVNADAGAMAGGALGPDVAGSAPALPPAARSLSAVTWSVKARTEGFPLVRHNVFFSGDYAAEFADIGRRGRLPQAPTVYVCAQDRLDDATPPEGSERLLVLVNAPANGDGAGLSEGDMAVCEKTVIDHLHRCGLRLPDGLDASVRTTPSDFNRMFPQTGGALYGAAMHGWGAAFKRPGAATRTPGLYLAGGGAHPGAGAPMAALSGRLAAQRLMQDRASTRRFHRGATPGGMSTRSARTVDTA